MEPRNAVSQELSVEKLLDELVLTEQAVAAKSYDEGYLEGEKRARQAGLNVALTVTKSVSRNRCFEVFIKHRFNTLLTKEKENKANGIEETPSEAQLKSDLIQNLQKLETLSEDYENNHLVGRLITTYFKVSDPVHGSTCPAYKALVSQEHKPSPYQF